MRGENTLVKRKRKNWLEGLKRPDFETRLDLVADVSEHKLGLAAVKRTVRTFNDKPDAAYFGSFFGAVRDTGLRCEPQFLGDLAFNLLVATTVYLEFRDRVSWEYVSYPY